MAYVIINHFEGGTREQYDAAVEVVHPEGGGLPEGQTGHYAGPSEEGWVVVAVWEDKASWERFRDETLMPGLQSLDDGFPGPPATIEYELAVSLPE